ncbi:hypothetical protein Pmani_008282 [Petrolisthes manimaculis]|uniref:ATP-dependent DNA helicase n=1 Tax=Petrolisthes manimaculis TaxID=1843537 RepID=A0AAE1Q5Z5_9EUCA|nr:hypothetical protein Pmani_008282 [Petrolisthes manimaculis]
MRSAKLLSVLVSLRRLASDREQKASARSLESEQVRAHRVGSDREQTATARLRECKQDQANRLERDRARHAAVRLPSVTSNFHLPGTAFRYNSNTVYAADRVIQLGGLTIQCTFCGAKKFPGETPGMCCSAGKVKLPALLLPTEPLHGLLKGDTLKSRQFLNKTRKYNSAFQMTSFGVDKEVVEPGFMPTFKVQGQVYHLIGSLLPQTAEEPKFLQIYFMGDKERECDKRCENFQDLDKTIVLSLQEILHANNHLVQSFKTAVEQEPPTRDYRVVIRADHRPAGEHARHFNEPSVNELAIFLVGDPHDNRDILLRLKDNSLQRVSQTHRSYDALQYPLIFWQGQDGYQFNIPQVDPHTGQPQASKKVSASDFYGYMIMTRVTVNPILLYRDLFHQFLVDMYAKVEGEGLLFIRNNQQQLRAESYVHLRDAVATYSNLRNVGQLVILPSTFTGGHHYMHERTQDAMTYVRTFDKPDLFITFTCNPQWEDIKCELLPGQKPQHRHDLIARVFHQKVIKLASILTKHVVFGPTRCHMYMIEWQKRGLPHSHLLLWLKDKIWPNQIDSIISAELPDRTADPGLFEIVKAQMVHGPCGPLNPRSPCMADGKCSKGYPKQFVADTQSGDDGYPSYRRRKPGEGGFDAVITMEKNRQVKVDNRWIVPYCPLLSKTFNAHINVEFCSSVKSIKYVCKYVNKGSDMAVLGLQNSNQNDEVTCYQMARYISSNEAALRLFKFSLHERYPTVVHLAVHLENGQRLSSKVWNRRKFGQSVEGEPGIKRGTDLGRVYTVHPNNFECYYLRLLLHHVQGPTSFQDLKSVDGHVCETYRQACNLRGLLENDSHWDDTLSEAAMSASASQLRNLFAIMLQACDLSDPNHLWETHKNYLSEDVLHRVRRQNPDVNVQLSGDVLHEALSLLEDKVISLDGKELKEYSLPAPCRRRHNLAQEVMRETCYDPEALSNHIAENEPKLHPEQRHAYNCILNSAMGSEGGIFFLDAPGGTGKTFVTNLLLAKVRQNEAIALAVTSSGIASTLLTGGRTAHSTFKLPLNLAKTDSPVCNISKGTPMAQVLQQTQLIVWYECTMLHRGALEAVNRTLKDIRSDTRIMGGITVVLAGDFRQTLPVIPKGTKADELKASVKASPLWRHVRKLHLTTVQF